ncbi:MAG: NAD(P)H-binding protein [Novosphingobium sp.]|nr:NAD(P)H-binding protein [Novosphingobium sp.]
MSGGDIGISRQTAPKRLCLVGSTGLVGWTMIEQAVSRSDIRLIGITRREVKLPHGARMEMLLADPAGWPDAIAAANAHVLVCALGTTWNKAGKDEAAFRAVDHDLVLACARAAQAAGIDHMIVVSSVSADPASSNRYLRVKGETERELSRLHFRRLDILRPGLLRGPRGDDKRLGERLAILASPIIDLFLWGKRRKYRSIRSHDVARAIFALAKERAGGHFIHERDAMFYAIRRAGG